MGVKHAREYRDILAELTDAVAAIEDGYTFFDMAAEEWNLLDPQEQQDVMEALADDVFYALGVQPALVVGSGVVTYQPKHHILQVAVNETELRIIRLV